MIKEFNSKSAKSFSDSVRLKLQEIGDEYGVTIEIGRMRLDGLKILDIPITASVEDIAPEETPSGKSFIWSAPLHGLQKSDLGRSFKFKGNLYTITGWSDSSRKYKVICERIFDGQVSRFVPSHIKRLLA